MSRSALIAVAGAIAWLMVALPAFIRHGGAIPVDPRWIAAFAGFGVLFVAHLVRPRVAFLLGQSVAALTLMLVRGDGYEGVLLAVIAMQLGTSIGRAAGIAWIAAQTGILAAAVDLQLGARAAWLLVPPYLGFQVVAYFTFWSMAREAEARAALAEANVELHAIQEILTHSSRIAERLRIAHELHDALGHRLTALSLNLEALLQRVHGPERTRAETAQSLARQLLNDVRQIVADSREMHSDRLPRALHALASAIPRPKVHLEIAEGLTVSDPQRAHILLRCTQEIVTNAARHSNAQNLWIVIERADDHYRIHAHDDGQGSDAMRDGFGLRGMRERVEGAGGELSISSRPGSGFDVTALVPLEQVA